ncbi:MATE family efflux transporter [Anaerovorax odorimutans]|uniref:Probable multidrug resistance protein NorM n=1 Tax=Anaerovorax odorimutans TaxID=109327 RepID=A0ABT1RSN2_9FIRM|nr:MATE family efflux transporter [Anaerovorax odorimutans]MCQ4638211.1 MATE family efflux transporter [Anaerovorax odorimutans]
MKDKKSFTEGSVAGHLIRFSLPVFFANLLQSLYGIADMLVVGRIVGKTGLAAISNGSMIGFVISSLCIGLTMGGTVIIAQYKGAANQQGQQQAARTLFTLSAITALLVIAAGLFSCRSVLSLLRVPEAAMADAYDYMRIYLLGTICVFGYNAVCSVLKGLGDSKNPLIFAAVAAALNVGLGVLLVGPLGLGTKGAAWATILAQGGSFLAAAMLLKKQSFLFDFRLRSFRIDRLSLKQILRTGLPSAAQMVIVNFSYLIITGMINVYGVDAAAAAGIGLKVNTFAAMPCWAIGQAVTAIVGQNMGAENFWRAKKAGTAGLWLNLAVTAVVVILVQFFAAPIISLFDPSSRLVLENGVLYLRVCCSLNSLVYCVMYTCDSFAIGAGNAMLAMTNSLLDSVIVRLLFGWILSSILGYGFVGICVGQALSPLLPALIGLIYFAKGKWKNRRLI